MVQPLVLAASMKAMEHLKRLLKHITGQPVAGPDSQAAFLRGGREAASHSGCLI